MNAIQEETPEVVVEPDEPFKLIVSRKQWGKENARMPDGLKEGRWERFRIRRWGSRVPTCSQCWGGGYGQVADHRGLKLD